MHAPPKGHKKPQEKHQRRNYFACVMLSFRGRSQLILRYRMLSSGW